MRKILNNIICIVNHKKWYKIKMSGRVLDHMMCSKCGREFTTDRYSTGPR